MLCILCITQNVRPFKTFFIVDSDTSEHDSLVTRAKHSREKLDNLKCPGKSKGFIHVLSH